MITLRPYQNDCGIALMNDIGNKGNPILQLPTGGGKSLIIADIARRCKEKWGGIKVLVLTHRAKLVEQDADKFRKLGMHPSIYCAELKRKEVGQFTLGTILSVARHADLFKDFHLVVIDECFTGDTLVATPNGKKRLDKLKENDYIITAIGNRKIQKIKKSIHNTVYNIRIGYEDNDRKRKRFYTIKCSARHPFLSTKGWVRAEQMVRGMELVGIQNMSELWQRVSTKQETRNKSFCEEKILLQKVLLSERKPDEKRTNKNKFVEQIEKYWLETASQIRQRVFESYTKEVVKSVKKGWVGSRIANKNRALSRWQWLSDKLQSGLRECTIKVGDRNGWKFTQYLGKKSTRQKERCFSAKYWVESIEVKEQRCGVALYDLQVAGHPSFFANGLLVHNCQMINNENEGSYRKFLAQLPKAKIIGLSATPFRLKGGACYGEGRLFNRISYKIGFADLVRAGYLTPPINYDANADDKFDDIHIVAGDFSKDDMNRHFNRIVEKSCEDLVKRMANRNYVLVFACSIVHANAIVKCLQDMGEKAMVYHSELSLEQDRLVINQFENKQFKYLVSIDKLGVGFDAPFVDGLGLMRPTMSRALAIQQLGRGSRLYEGKENFLVADYAGNIRRHNLLDPDAYDVPWEKLAKAKRVNNTADAPSKVCPHCQAICPTRTTTCQCGYKFPPKLTVKADTTKGKETDRVPIQIWQASIEHNDKHNYVKLLVGNFLRCRPVFFFPEDTGYAKTKTLIYWTKVFGEHGFKLPMNIDCDWMVLYLNKMKGMFTEAEFEQENKFWKLTKLIKEQNDGRHE